MPRHPTPTLDDLDAYRGAFVTPGQLAAYLGMPRRTLTTWCRMAWIPGAKRRNPYCEGGDWLIPVASAREIEVRVGLKQKHTAA